MLQYVKIYLLFILFFGYASGRAQTVSVAFNSRWGPVAGDYCDFTIHSEGMSCGKVVVTVSQGAVDQKGADCYYTLKPAKPGPIVFTFSTKTDTGMRVIGEQKLIVKRYPTPVVTLGALRSDTVNAAMARIQQGPLVYRENCFGPYIPPFQVYRYKVMIVRGGEVVFDRNHYDPRKQQILFDKETQEFMKTFRAGDVLMIKNIAAYGAGAHYTDLKDITIVGE